MITSPYIALCEGHPTVWGVHREGLVTWCPPLPPFTHTPITLKRGAFDPEHAVVAPEVTPERESEKKSGKERDRGRQKERERKVREAQSESEGDRD